jgi:dienelactone hydrolase
MRTERVQIPAEGAEIDAYLAVPDGQGPSDGCPAQDGPHDRVRGDTR